MKEYVKEFLVLLVALFLVSAAMELIIYYAGIEPLMENKAINFLRIFVQCGIAYLLAWAYNKHQRNKRKEHEEA